jgi:hypothetical protein
MSYLAAGLSAFSSIKGGQAQQYQQEVLANQDRADASSAQIQGQAAALNERKRAKYLRSRALSVAGASGAGVSDPTVVDIMAGIETEGEVRALNALYEGDTAAAGLRASAVARRKTGGAMARAGYLQAGATIAGANPSFFAKYG